MDDSKDNSFPTIDEIFQQKPFPNESSMQSGGFDKN